MVFSSEEADDYVNMLDMSVSVFYRNELINRGESVLSPASSNRVPRKSEAIGQPSPSCYFLISRNSSKHHFRNLSMLRFRKHCFVWKYWAKPLFFLTLFLAEI